MILILVLPIWRDLLAVCHQGVTTSGRERENGGEENHKRAARVTGTVEWGETARVPGMYVSVRGGMEGKKIVRELHE